MSNFTIIEVPVGSGCFKNSRDCSFDSRAGAGLFSLFISGPSRKCKTHDFLIKKWMVRNAVWGETG